MIRRKGRLFLVIAAVAALSAFTAAAASASTAFTATTYPNTSTVSSGSFSFHFPKGLPGWEYVCKGNETAKTTLEGPTNPLILDVPDGFWSCAANSPLYTWTKANMNGCDFRFQPGVEGKGTLSISPPGCGPIKLALKEAQPNGLLYPECVTIPSQSLPASISSGVVKVIPQNELEEEEARIPRLKYATAECNVTGPASYEDGTMGGMFGTELTVKEGVTIAQVEAEKYPVTLKGSGLSTFVAGSAVTCTGSSLEVLASGATTQLNLTASYSGCTIATESGPVVASILMNGCHWTLDVEKPSYTPRWGVACNNAGEAIEIRVSTLKAKCANLRPQQNKTFGMTLSTVGSGSSRGIKVAQSYKETGLTYELVGKSCTKTGTPEFVNGALQGETTLLGTNGGKAVGVYLAG